MKKHLRLIIASIACFTAGIIVTKAFNGNAQEGYILDHEKDLATEQPGPHDGGGKTKAFNFFAKAADPKLVFRKRILYPGSSIGYHLQEADEIYYIVSGRGEMTMNGKTFTVQSGDGVLTRPGSSHGLKPTGNDSLVVIINYQAK